MTPSQPQVSGPQQPIRVLVADDHIVVRLGLVTLINNQPDMQVVAEAANGQEVIDLAREHKPHVILMDLRMPGLSGDQTIAAVCAENTGARVIVLTIHKGDEAAYQALRAGARGYLIKDTPTEEIVAAIRDVHAGKQRIEPAIAEQVAQRIGKAGLSVREVDVLKLIAHGLSNKEVANELGVTEATAKKHMTSVLTKLGAKDRTHAVRIGLERGIISLE
jgi:two-component system NarL family response regulator